MSENPEILCFHCGLSVGDPPALNLMDDGEICPVCRDRALQSIAPALPSRAQEVVGEEASESELESQAADQV